MTNLKWYISIACLLGQLTVVQAQPTLGSVAGNGLESTRFSHFNANRSSLIIHSWRHTAGANWLSASTSITQQTDVTNQGFITFNPPSGLGGLALGVWATGNAININASAAVGMGTWDTRGYKLAVVGGILADKIKVAVPGSAQWADYVFAKNYQLMPLAQVEQYIKAHQHLPNVPSAAEMVKEGNDLGKTTAKLLEKIEELTLYMIELKKENEGIKNTNGQMLQKITALDNENTEIKIQLKKCVNKNNKQLKIKTCKK